MGFLKDNLIPFFKKRTLPFVESYAETEGFRTFVFEKPADLAWKAGQYGLFTITHKPVKNGTRPFSVSSAPVENAVRITTRIGEEPSEFKQALLDLTPGMSIMMRGPVGPFYLGEEKPTLFIAGGVGITPFRSMLKELDSTPNQFGQSIHLLYLNGNGQYLFQQELDNMVHRTLASVTYLESRDELGQEIRRFVSQYHNGGQYYIAGPQSMVDAVSGDLLNLKIAKPNIKKDAFFGY